MGHELLRGAGVDGVADLKMQPLDPTYMWS